jgi:hypothetical protein
MWVSPVAGHAGDGGHHVAFFILIEVEIFFVDLSCHFKHMTGHFFFRFGIAGEIQSVGSAVIRGGVAEITFYAQGGLPVAHDLVQVFVADIFRQDLEVPFRLFIVCRLVGKGRGTGGGHANDHQSGKYQCNCELFAMEHSEHFRSPI